VLASRGEVFTTRNVLIAVGNGGGGEEPNVKGKKKREMGGIGGRGGKFRDEGGTVAVGAGIRVVREVSRKKN